MQPYVSPSSPFQLRRCQILNKFSIPSGHIQCTENQNLDWAQNSQQSRLFSFDTAQVIPKPKITQKIQQCYHIWEIKNPGSKIPSGGMAKERMLSCFFYGTFLPVNFAAVILQIVLNSSQHGSRAYKTACYEQMNELTREELQYCSSCPTTHYTTNFCQNYHHNNAL